MKYLIGVDLGTTNIKGALYDEEGHLLANESAAYETDHTKKGMAEQNPEDWWEGARRIFKTIHSSVGKEIINQIAGICVSSQTPTLLPVNQDGEPLRKAMIWMDSRAQKEMERILDDIGFDHYVRITGMLPDVSFIPPKLLWYVNHERALFDKTSWFVQANGYINYRLTNVFSMDMDQASLTQCLDVSTGTWAEEIESAVGVDFGKYFPAPVTNDTVIGCVTKEAANETGLCEGTAVVAGSSDAIAAMYASGLSKLGEASEISGSSSLVFAGTQSRPTDYHTVGAHACSIEGIPYVFNAPITATGSSVKWYLRHFGLYEEQIEKEEGIKIYDTLNREVLESPPGSGGAMFFPYLMGERAPLWNNHAKGMFIGLSMSTTRKDMIRAIFEGTAYALKSVIDEFKRNGTEVNSLRVVGGGALSESWLKIKASILNVPVYVLDEKTGDVPFGDALIAGLAVGVYHNLTETIKKIIQVKKVIQPDKEWVEVYEKRYPFFRRFYSVLDESLKTYDRTIAN